MGKQNNNLKKVDERTTKNFFKISYLILKIKNKEV